MHSIVSNDSVSRQWRPRSDCADAQANLGICCPHIPKDMFSHGLFNQLRGNNTHSGMETVKIVLPPFWKGIYSKRKNRPPFKKSLCIQESKQEVTKVVSLDRNGEKFTKCIKPCPAEPGYTLPLQTVKIQVCWLLKKPTDLDLHCLPFSI